MNIDGMSDQEKSAALLRLMGQAVDCTCGKPGCTVGREIDSGRGWFVPTVKNLYDPANMALAWRVLNWANQDETISQVDWHIYKKYFDELLEMPPADAQQAWLDKILTLAIEAGMVTE
jgi:hypothetical protein